MSEPLLYDLQTSVQQKLGRFVMQVQRYEMLVKALLIDSEASGTVETAQANLQRRKKEFSDKPMGFIHGELKKSYLRPVAELGEAVEEEWTEEVVLAPTFRTSFRMEMSADELTSTRARMDEFKALRNRVVHHLLEDFELTTAGACESAVIFLDEAFEHAKSAYGEVRRWADTVLAAREHFVSFVQSREFEDALFHGIFPGGVVDWPAATPVRLLRRFEEATPASEMTRLDLALKAIQSTHPVHGPKRYFCKDWHELLTRSGQFEVHRVKGNASERGATWYRSR